MCKPGLDSKHSDNTCTPVTDAHTHVEIWRVTIWGGIEGYENTIGNSVRCLDEHGCHVQIVQKNGTSTVLPGTNIARSYIHVSKEKQ